MRKVLFALLMLGASAVYGCPVCDKQPPRILKGITHGAGPQTNWDYVIVYLVAAVVVATLIFSILWLVRPEEKDTSHIKRAVLNF